jgi:hypothetical protein
MTVKVGGPGVTINGVTCGAKEAVTARSTFNIQQRSSAPP